MTTMPTRPTTNDTGGSPPRPRPHPTPTSAPFWEGLAAETVRLQRCGACGSWVFYPRHRCPTCLSADLDWYAVSGRGTVFTFSIARQPTSAHFADDVPQLLAVVELDEGPRLTTTLVDVEPEQVTVGMAVEPVFDHGGDGVTLLRYRPAADRDSRQKP
jgi:uncharacterized OB-fold protein